MKIKWTEQPSYETMQRLWKRHPEVTPIEQSTTFEAELKEVLENSVLVCDQEDPICEEEIFFDQIQLV